MAAKLFRLIQDDDGHWYLIRADQGPAFEAWLAAAPYWENYDGPTFESIGCSPSKVTFTNPTIED